MPKPYKGDEAEILLFNPYAFMMKQPACAMWIAAIALAWTTIEAFLSALYVNLVFSDEMPRGLTGGIVLEAFEKTPGLGTKRKLILEATETRLGKAAKDDFSKILQKVQDAYDARNKIVHARWAMVKDTHELVKRPTILSRDEPLLYDVDDLKPTLEKLQKTYNEIITYYADKIRPKFAPPSELGNLLAQMYAAELEKGSS